MGEAGGYRPVDYSSRVEGRLSYLPDDFDDYLDIELHCSVLEDYEEDFIGWVFSSREYHKHQRPPNLLQDILGLQKKIKDVFSNVIHRCHAYPTLVQFWAPTMTREGRSYLTTQNQPFALSTCVGRIDDIKGLCGYRMISKDYKFCMDRECSNEELGVLVSSSMNCSNPLPM